MINNEKPRNKKLFYQLICTFCATVFIFGYIGLSFHNNKASALSRPTDNTEDIYSSFLSSSFIANYGLNGNSSLFQGYGLYRDDFPAVDYSGSVTPYSTDILNDRYIGTSIDSFVSYASFTNKYYDPNDTDYTMSQYFSHPLDYGMSVYRCSSIEIINESSDLIYIPSVDYLANIKLFFATQLFNVNNIYSYLPFNTSRTTDLIYQFSRDSNITDTYALDILSSGYVPIRAKLELSFTVMNALGKDINYTITAYSYDNAGTGGLFYEHQPATFNTLENRAIIQEALNTGVHYNNCYLIDNLTLTCTLESATFRYNYTGGSLSGQFSEYNSSIQGDNFSGWSFNENEFLPYGNIFGTMYLNIPLYEENYFSIQEKLYNANKLYLTPYWNAEQSIFGFWANFLDIEILPNFKLSYFLVMALGMVFVTIFVRMFR